MVAGADEAGRGALAGPLVVAAVCLDLGRMTGRTRRALSGVDDSKRLTASAREDLAKVIMREAERVIVRVASAAVIDRDGLHVTNVRLLAEAIERLQDVAAISLVDGRPLGPDAPAHLALVGGDRRSASVAAASIVAKSVRDRVMRGPVASMFPEYGFDRHVGYATRSHRRTLIDIGPCPVHRRSFIWTDPAVVAAEARPR